MSEKEKMVAQGTCRYCGQLRNVMYWSDDELPRAELAAMVIITAVLISTSKVEEFRIGGRT